MAGERTRRGTAADARNRRIIASRYLEIADLAATEEGAGANNVVVGLRAARKLVDAAIARTLPGRQS